jgi:flagellar FliL protein
MNRPEGASMSAVMADPAAVDDAPVSRRPKKKLILIGAAVLALVLALGGGAVVFLKHRAAQAAAAADDDATAPDPSNAAAANVVKAVPFYLPLDPFIVNLADREVDRYAQIGITLELESSMSGDQIKAYMPAIRNAVLLILANKSSKDLLSREGKEQLALEIQREAVRPMGIEIALPEPVTAAPVIVAMAASSAAAASAAGAAAAPASAIAADPAASAKAKPRRRAETQRNPIQHVHFSSFIIQ